MAGFPTLRRYQEEEIILIREKDDFATLMRLLGMSPDRLGRKGLG